jgi:dimethylaniline monooxygenase (N-oxide forming)
MKALQVCVIGAGVSGLVSAKIFLEEGYDVTVFEKQTGLGGVWEKSRAYPGLSIQNPRDTYAFSDYPMPTSYPEWPSGEQICAYLESYAQHFNVLEKIRFGAEVTSVKRREAQAEDRPKWIINVRFQDNLRGETRQEEFEFDFVVVCNGTLSIPNIPNFPGMEEFVASGGHILHSTQFYDRSQIEGKRIVVIGFGKSATDIATVAATTTKECTLVFRQVLWKIPKFFLGLINVKYVLLTRFAESWMPYRKLQGWDKILHTIGKPLVWLFWRTNEMLLRLQFSLDSCKLVPEQPMDKLIGCSIGLAPKGFFDLVRSGKIKTKKTGIKEFSKSGLKLENGENLSADTVIFGTGFCQNMPFLEKKYLQQIIDEKNIIHLYRHLIHPSVPQMGFVGYNYSGCAQLTSEIGARWLVECFKGNLSLPSQQEMLEDIEAELEWRKKERPYAILGGACITPFTFHYIDELMQDMGLKKRRKPWNPIGEFIMPADPSAYSNLRQELISRG